MSEKQTQSIDPVDPLYPIPCECQETQTVVLAPLVRIEVDFKRGKVAVTQNGEPLANAQASSTLGRLVVEVRPICSVPPEGREPTGG